MAQNTAHSGTLESNDIYIVIEEKPQDYGIQIDLKSIVFAQFGDSIKSTLLDTIKSCGVTTGLAITANDKGALACTIEARMKTALSRAGLIGGDK